jgi:hypothetical protein
LALATDRRDCTGSRDDPLEIGSVDDRLHLSRQDLGTTKQKHATKHKQTLYLPSIKEMRLSKELDT